MAQILITHSFIYKYFLSTYYYALVAWNRGEVKYSYRPRNKEGTWSSEGDTKLQVT